MLVSDLKRKFSFFNISIKSCFVSSLLADLSTIIGRSFPQPLSDNGPRLCPSRGLENCLETRKREKRGKIR